MVDRLRPKVVLTTSPPHSIHDVGIWLSSQRPQLPWVADFRDPYLIDRRFGLRRLRRLRAGQHRRFEADVYAHAALLPMRSTSASVGTSSLSGGVRRIRTLTNGVPLILGAIAPVLSPAGRRSIRVMGASDLDQRCRLPDPFCSYASRVTIWNFVLSGRGAAVSNSRPIYSVPAWFPPATCRMNRHWPIARRRPFDLPYQRTLQ